MVGDKLVTRDFGTGTRGFSASDDPGMAVCIRPGTELAFAGEVACLPAGLLGWKTKDDRATERPSSGKSTRTRWPRTTTRSSFRMGAPCC